MAKRAKQAELKPNADPTKIAECAAEYEMMMGQIARAKQKLGVMLDGYKKNHGVSPIAIKRDYRRRNMSTAEIQAELAEDALYARALGRIEWKADGQGDFAAAIDVAPPSVEAAASLRRVRAHTDGYNSGKHGGRIEACPHNVGSEEFVAWRDGWQDGKEDRLAKNPDADKVTQAEPRKRGRNAMNVPAPAVADEIGAPAGRA